MGSGDLVFVNGFSGSSSLCALKISASGVEKAFDDDFRTPVLSFLNGFSVSSTLCGRRFQRQP